jgi:hypothetical protein
MNYRQYVAEKCLVDETPLQTKCRRDGVLL